jgi:hypothetical protein
MEDVQFDESSEGPTFVRHTATRKEEGGFIGFLIKHQYAKTRQQAQYILLGVAVAALIASVIIFMSTGIESSSTPPPMP